VCALAASLRSYDMCYPATSSSSSIRGGPGSRARVYIRAVFIRIRLYTVFLMNPDQSLYVSSQADPPSDALRSTNCVPCLPLLRSPATRQTRQPRQPRQPGSTRQHPEVPPHRLSPAADPANPAPGKPGNPAKTRQHPGNPATRPGNTRQPGKDPATPRQPGNPTRQHLATRQPGLNTQTGLRPVRVMAQLEEFKFISTSMYLPKLT
jgi:hypothetical protein